jgi:hypothetical protein
MPQRNAVPDPELVLNHAQVVLRDKLGGAELAADFDGRLCGGRHRLSYRSV